MLGNSGRAIVNAALWLLSPFAATHGGKSEIPSAPRRRTVLLLCALRLITASTPLHCLLLTPDQKPVDQRLPSRHCCQTQTECSDATISLFSAHPANVHFLRQSLSVAKAPVL